ncbi:MAG TPA: hypothetical protein VLD62_13355, partial [Acidimicrobiia bacterium]|nr:hypothetical protein [Acidimicrobiia bacterium]
EERTISGDRVTEVMGTPPGLMGIHEPAGFGKFDPEKAPLDASMLPPPSANGGGDTSEPETEAILETADEVIED